MNKKQIEGFMILNSLPINDARKSSASFMYTIAVNYEIGNTIINYCAPKLKLSLIGFKTHLRQSPITALYKIALKEYENESNALSRKIELVSAQIEAHKTRSKQTQSKPVSRNIHYNTPSPRVHLSYAVQ